MVIWFRVLGSTISIHAPRGGSDTPRSIFPARRVYFNPRSPWGERRAAGASQCSEPEFQSTLPVGGATVPVRRSPATGRQFQSTLPVGGATVSKLTPGNGSKSFQSTLPVGGATTKYLQEYAQFIFQSTLPVGGATISHQRHRENPEFQSTLPVGGATGYICANGVSMDISIHAPRGGSDP